MKRFHRGIRNEENFIPYYKLSRKKKRKSYIDIKNISRKSPYAWAKFWDYDPEAEYHWDDIYILSRKYPLMYYNCTIETIYSHYNELVRAKTKEIVDDICVQHGHHAMDYIRMQWAPTDNPHITRMVMEAAKIPYFDDKTIYQVYEEKEQELLSHPETNGIELDCGIQFDKSYGCGIGMTMIVPQYKLKDETILTEDTVDKIVRAWLDRGEPEYTLRMKNPTLEEMNKKYHHRGDTQESNSTIQCE